MLRSLRHRRKHELTTFAVDVISSRASCRVEDGRYQPSFCRNFLFAACLAAVSLLPVSQLIMAIDAPNQPMAAVDGGHAPVLADFPVVSSSGFFHRQPQRIQLGLGVRGRIECPAEPDPPTTLIVWSRDGFGVLDTSESSPDARSSRPRTFMDVAGRYTTTAAAAVSSTTETPVVVTDRRLTSDPLTGALIIDPVSRADDGIYRCTAYTPRDDSRTTYQIRVVVRGTSAVAMATVWKLEA